MAWRAGGHQVDPITDPAWQEGGGGKRPGRGEGSGTRWGNDCCSIEWFWRVLADSQLTVKLKRLMESLGCQARRRKLKRPGYQIADFGREPGCQAHLFVHLPASLWGGHFSSTPLRGAKVCWRTPLSAGLRDAGGLSTAATLAGGASSVLLKQGFFSSQQRLHPPFFGPDIWVKSDSNLICLSQIWVKKETKNARNRDISCFATKVHSCSIRAWRRRIVLTPSTPYLAVTYSIPWKGCSLFQGLQHTFKHVLCWTFIFCTFSNTYLQVRCYPR